MEDTGVGVIVDYKYLCGPKAGKVYKRRFEAIKDFVDWAAEYDSTGIVEILNSKVVTSDMVYWDDRWLAVKA